LVVVEMLHTHLYERVGPILTGLAKVFPVLPPDIRPSCYCILQGIAGSTDKQVITPLRRTDR
jgi:hypothetical protein